MSELSYLEKLLDGVEVEWRNLGDTSLFEIANNGRKPVKASLRIAGETPYYGANNIQDYVDGYTHDGEYVLIAEDGSASLENYSIQYATGKFWANNHVHVVRGKERVHSRFLYHYLCIVNFLPFLTGGGRAKLTKGQLIEIPVPIPCPDNPEKSLAIQSEIVRILDKFTALTAELTAELTMRKKQYNYYRDKLLSFEEGGVEWKTLGEIVKMRAGQHISARNIVDGKEGDFVYPCFGGNGIRGYVKEKSHDGEHLLIGRQGALCGNVQRMKGQFYATEHAVVVSAMQGIDIDWAFHMLTTMNLNQYASKSAQPGLAVGKLQELKLLVPSIERQKYIAKILDKFDTLTSSITEGLPREIELRQKQYEYYRDLLFSFPKPETASN
ncbi:restriction endonuclease subunit S [Salmonella enterica subsp. enterica serovar Orion]|uniref:restriction endonuclease subunit S n=1 Tax=Enterobacteriaceae TaxID=543 RepID=UPI0006A635F1|nr:MULTISPECIES: restriction endonuclease subunit S [Enterobacteriaceae]EAU1174090.1 restriction endonuclease subunit S [Salmonella enterica]EBK3298336.1 restriction endonuclease subunit S [Salmonella enterica subsp. enterica serovar Orion]EGY8416788.1 restriction endonuclease subunit S [Salmonella enterica subsp. enterica serovar Mbandaka]EBP1510479.1 restriction endonuclease subunit S [Salmonella enterica]EBS8494020.1 restriction endonuclease subunit S [Salmonella enterica]